MTAENTTENQEDPRVIRARRAALAGRLAALRDRASAAYAAITAAEAELAVIAAERVTAERALRQAVAERTAAAQAAGAHQRARPSVLAQLASGLRAWPDWRQRQAALNTAVTAADQPVTAARRAVAEIREEFAAQVRSRGEAATELRRLTAQCAAVQAELAACRPGDGNAG